MDIIYLLIPLALVLLVAAVGTFFWAVRNDQFDDLDREASRILFDEDAASPKPEEQDLSASSSSSSSASKEKQD